MMNKVRSALIVGLVGSFIVGCSSVPSTQEFTRISHVDAGASGDGGLTGIRYQALRDAALSIGARGGLAWRAGQIRSQTFKHEASLDKVFNFYGLILDDNILPPVLIEGRQTLDQPQDDIVRVSERSYVIVSQAKFVTNPPNWRDYLRMEYAQPPIPDRSLLPRNEAEKKVWTKYIKLGWDAGVSQANTIFLENLGRLKRDYEGMVRYHTLLTQGMVSKPYVGRVDLGITGDSTQMSVNDRVLRITAKPGFMLNGEGWQADFVKSKPEPDPKQE